MISRCVVVNGKLSRSRLTKIFPMVVGSTKIISNCFSSPSYRDNRTDSDNGQKYTLKDDEVDLYEAMSKNFGDISKIPDYNPSSHQEFGYKLDFTARCKDIYLTQEGAYATITKEDLDKYLPESVAGEMEEEFEATNSSSWMIRDATKLVCRVIDSFKDSRDEAPKLGLRFPINMPRYTDVNLVSRWPGSSMEVYSYGNHNLAPPCAPVHKNMKVVRGPGSVVETCISAIKRQSESLGFGSTIPSKVLLTGERGVGKSAVLSQAVLHARKSGFICMYIPQAWMQMNGGFFVEPYSGLVPLDDNELRRTKFDNIFMSAVVLRGFYAAHKDELRSIPIHHKPEAVQKKYMGTINAIRKRYVLEIIGDEQPPPFLHFRESFVGSGDTFLTEDQLDEPILNNRDIFDIRTFKLETLEDLLLVGLIHKDFSGGVTVDLLEQITTLRDPSRPFLLAVDEVNILETQSVYKYDDKVMTADSFVVPSAIKFVSAKKDFNMRADFGPHTLCIGATTMRYPLKKKGYPDFFQTTSSVPLTIKVPRYSDVEFLAAVKYYVAKRHIDNYLTDQHIIAYRMHCSSNPRFTRTNTGFFNLINGEYAGEVFMKLLASGGVYNREESEMFAVRSMNSGRENAPNASYMTLKDSIEDIMPGENIGDKDNDEFSDAEDEEVGGGDTSPDALTMEDISAQEDDFDVDARDMTEEEVRIFMSDVSNDVDNEELDDLELVGSEFLLNNFKILGQRNPQDQKYESVTLKK